MNGRPHRRQQVVKIHNKMDKTVERDSEGGMASADEAEDKPNTQRHNSVMVEMQESDLIALLTQYEKRRIEKVDKCREVEAVAYQQ